MGHSYWSKMPCSWQKQSTVHAVLRSKPCGTAIAALKLYITFCLHANFYGAKSPEEKTLAQAGCVQKTIQSLCELTGMSKPVVIGGLRLLMEMQIIERLEGRPTTYQIVDFTTATYWVKLPRRHLHGADDREVEKIALLPNRGQEIFEALQLYLYIASVREKESQQARVTYTTVCSVLCMSRNAVSRAISTLVARELLSVRIENPNEKDYMKRCNIYWLQGKIAP